MGKERFRLFYSDEYKYLYTVTIHEINFIAKERERNHHGFIGELHDCLWHKSFLFLVKHLFIYHCLC